MRITAVLLAMLCAAGLSGVAFAQAPAQEVSGTLHVIWGDPPNGAPVFRYLLSGDDGVARLVDIDQSMIAAAGGLMQVNGTRMRVQLAAAPTPQGVERARSLLPLTSLVNPGIVAESQALSAQAQRAVTRAYVTILCRFADTINELPGTKERYEQLMGSAFPGVNHYWTEVTQGGITLDGSVVVGWYTLPQPRSAYVTADNSSANLNKLLTDCIGVADADVDFTRFHGINMQFNKNLDCCSWGGGRTMTLDGATRFWGTTWEAAWAGFGTYAHEIGHSLGLPHSGGPYGNVYDSRYDVMSASSWYRDPTSDFLMGSHTIGYHKDRLGVIPAARRVIAAAPTTRIVLERSALPRPNGGAQLVVIPIREETNEFYTVESRRGGGYDGPLAQAIVIHYVNPRRSEPAQVVDVDGNGNVNDHGSQWIANELFRDLQHGITVAVDSIRDEQVHITVLRGDRPWLVLEPGLHAHRVAYGATDVVQDSAALQASSGLAWLATTARRRAQVLNPSGTGPVMLRWQRQTRGLAPGVYVDTIRVLSPGAAGHLAFAVDSLIVAEPSGAALSMSLSATARADSIFQTSTGFADSIMIRFAGAGAATAAWTVTKSRSSTIVQTLLAGVGNGVVRWYHWASTLSPGIYVDTITVTAPTVAGSPIMIIDTLHVHALPSFTVARFTDGHALLPEGSTARDSIRVTPTGRWATAGTWTAGYQGSPTYIRLLDQRPFTGSIVVPFERRTESRAPGLYVDTLRLATTIPSSGVFVIDTMEVQPSPLALQLSWNSRRDSVVAGVAQDADSVLVLTTGPNAHTRSWGAVASGTGRITLARRDAFTAAGRGTGTGWLRWFRNVAGRSPGLHVDTITVSYADTALSALLVDSVVILQPVTATVSVTSRRTYMVPGPGTTRDSVQLVLAGAGNAGAAWTAHARSPWLKLEPGGGTGPAWLKWTRSAEKLALGTYVDTISVAVHNGVGIAPSVLDSLHVVAPIVVTGDSVRPVAPVGRAFADSLKATGGTGVFAWDVISGTLPAGLALGPTSGVITGQATTTGEHQVGVRATSVGFSATRALHYSALPPPAVVSDSVRPAALLAQSYTDSLRAIGGSGTYAWSIVNGTLPTGLALSAAGVITGTPTHSGSTRAVARVTSATLTADLPLRINVNGPVVITTTALRAGRMGALYADTLRASGGAGAISWSVLSGALPAGLTLQPATGALGGVLEEAGEFTAIIRAIAGDFETTTSLQLSVSKPAVAESAVMDQLLGAGTLSADDTRFLDLLGNRNGRLDIGDIRAWLRDAGRLNANPPSELQRMIERLDTARLAKERAR